MLRRERSECRSIFRRKTLLLNAEQPSPGHLKERPQAQLTSAQPLPSPQLDEGATVLVINSCHEMAKEITFQLTLAIPGCSIMYAPTIETAKWILKRRKVSLVVSSPLLPDGSIARLRLVLERMESPADLLVVGSLHGRSAEIFADSAYKCTALRRIRPAQTESTSPKQDLHKHIKSLGADIRNDLNNPLQEIVAMVFVARSGAQASQTSDCALNAIETAAKNMSKVINALEDKIRGVISIEQR